MIILGRRIGFSFEVIAHFSQFCGCIKCIIGIPILYQLFCIGSVNWFAFTLAIGSIGSFLQWTFIRLQAGPFEAIENIFFSTWNKAGLIGIFYPENKITTLAFGKKVII